MAYNNRVSRSIRTDYINETKFPQRQGDAYQVLRLGTEGKLYWDTIAVQDSNIITVSKGGSPSTIEDALAMCTGADEDTPYIVNISAGVYEENELTIPQYVTLAGTSISSVTIRPNGNHTCINMSPHSYLYLVQLEGTGLDQQVGIKVEDCDVYSLLFKVSVSGMYTGMEVSANVVDSEFYCEYVDFDECTNTCVSLLSSTFANFVNFDDCYMFAPVASALEVCMTVACDMCEFNCENLFIEGYVTSGTSRAIEVNASGVFITRNLFVRGFDVGLSIPADGGTPIVKIGTVIFDDNTLDVSCPNPNAIGYFSGITTYNKISINSSAPFYQYNRDLQIVTVKKRGGDFTTINNALGAITDATVNRRYIIDVGSGVFVENPITMKPYVSIIGKSSHSSIIQSADNDTTLITGYGHSEVEHLALIGPTNAGKSSIFYDGHEHDDGPFSISDVNFGSAHTLLTINSTTGNAHIEINNCGMRPSAAFVYGVRINSTGGNVVTVHMDNDNFLSDGTLVTAIEVDGLSVVRIHDTYVTGTGAGTGLDIIGCDNTTTGNVVLNTLSVGINIPNNANTPYINMWNMIMSDCTTDATVSNTATTGIINGKLERTKCTIAANSLTLNITGDAGLSLTGDIYTGTTFNTSTNLTKSIQYSTNIGLVTGGVMSTNGVLTVRVAAGTGYLTVGASPTEYLQYTTWIQTDVLISANNINHIYVSNAGTVLTATSQPSVLTNVYLGAVYAAADILYYHRTPKISSYTSSKIDTVLRDAFGTIVQSGLVCTINGVSTKQMDVTSGKYWYAVASYSPSGGAAITYTQIYRAVAGYTITTGLVNVNCTQYDDGSGTLQNIPAGQFAKHALYMVGEGADEMYFLIVGQETFASLAAAETGALPIPPTFFNENTISVAGIIVDHDLDLITEVVDIRPTIAFRSGTQSATSDHNSLSNLTVGNPHTQYLLASGATAMTGDLNLNGNDLNSVATINLVNTNTVTLQANAATANYTLTLPTSSGAINQALTTDGTGVLSWAGVMVDPLTTNEDLIVRRLGTTTRMGVGSNGTRLGVFNVSGVQTVGYYLPIEPRREYYFYDEFLGDNSSPYGDTNWYTAGTTIKDPLSGTSMIGHVMLRSGTTRTVISKAPGASLFVGGIVLGKGVMTIECGVYIAILLDTADVGDIMTIGLGNDSRSNNLLNQQNGVYFKYHPSLYGAQRWSIHAANADVVTSADTASAVTAGVYYRLKIVATNTTSVAYYVNDTLVGTIVTNVPTAGIAPLIRTSVGSLPNTDSLHLDYVMCHYIFTTPR
uniref:Uncharacterized protein n=1 Tax=viral metagenome TaxID=1070528 RepID=A0A6C0M0H8_9ZZZZ